MRKYNEWSILKYHVDRICLERKELMRDMAKRYLKGMALGLAVWSCLSVAGFANDMGMIDQTPEVEEGVQNPEISVEELTNISCTFEKGTVYDYTGEEITPQVIQVTFCDENGEMQTRELEGYQVVSYKDNKNIGKGSIELSIDGYTGSIWMDGVFEIQFGSISGVKASPASYKTIKISWNKLPGADGYVVYRRTAKAKNFTKISTIKKGSTTSYTDGSSSLKLGTTYEYRVQPYRMAEQKTVYGDYSKVVSQKLQVGTTSVTKVSSASYNSLKITWKKVSGVSGYVVYRSDSQNGKYTKIATVKSGTSYTDKKRSCGKTYYYKVQGYRTVSRKNYYGNSSGAKSGFTVPNKINFNSQTSYASTKTVLRWNKSTGASGYEIWRSSKEKSGYTLLKTLTKSDTTKYTDQKLSSKQVYYYKIRPYRTVNSKKVYGSFSSVYKKYAVSERIKSITKYTNVRYVSGGRTNKGWDCSGFTQWALKYIAGVDIPKASSAQAVSGTKVDKNNMSKWKPGDVLVYSSGSRVCHVGLYLGDGKMMHALSTKYGTLIQDVTYYERWDSGTRLTGVRRFF